LEEHQDLAMINLTQMHHDYNASLDVDVDHDEVRVVEEEEEEE